MSTPKAGRPRQEAGRRLRQLHSQGSLPAGIGELVWDGLSDNGAATPGGIYFCHLQAAGTGRLAVIKLAKVD